MVNIIQSILALPPSADHQTHLSRWIEVVALRAVGTQLRIEEVPPRSGWWRIKFSYRKRVFVYTGAMPAVSAPVPTCQSTGQPCTHCGDQCHPHPRCSP